MVKKILGTHTTAKYIKSKILVTIGGVYLDDYTVTFIYNVLYHLSKISVLFIVITEYKD